MRPTLMITVVAAAITGALADNFNVDFYSDSNCGNWQFNIHGTHDAVVGSTDFGFGGENPPKSFIVTLMGGFVDSMDLNGEKYYYEGPCGASDNPGFKYYDGGVANNCLPIDDITATEASVYFSVCDASGFDNIYKEKKV